MFKKVMEFLRNEFGIIGRVPFELDPFTFTMNYLPATLSVTTNASFLVQADSAFVWVKGEAIVTATDNTTFNTTGQWPFLIVISDSGSGRDLMDTGVHLYNHFGTAERPFILGKPKIFDPNSTITGKLQNLSGTSYNVRLAYHGFKVFGSVEAYKQSRLIHTARGQK